MMGRGRGGREKSVAGILTSRNRTNLIPHLEQLCACACSCRQCLNQRHAELAEIFELVMLLAMGIAGGAALR